MALYCVVASAISALIDYINSRLNEWAKWSMMRVDGWYGTNTSQFTYDEPMPGHERHVIVPSNSRCIETEEGVAWLYLTRRKLGACVVMHYREHPEWSAEMQAVALKVSVSGLYLRLRQAHNELWGYFLDRSVGIVPQTEGLRKAKRVTCG